MKTCKKLIVALMICLTLVALVGTVAFATPDHPFSTYDVHTTVVKNKADVATAYITRCSETPVDNYLRVFLRVQYRDGDKYIWDPVDSEGEEMYYFKEGEDIEKATLSISHHYIYFAQGVFYARCKDGATKVLYDNWSRPTN